MRPPQLNVSHINRILIKQVTQEFASNSDGAALPTAVRLIVNNSALAMETRGMTSPGDLDAAKYAWSSIMKQAVANNGTPLRAEHVRQAFNLTPFPSD